jgi:2-oxoisovalerate dehydrogenase E1 component alpha subunit
MNFSDPNFVRERYRQMLRIRIVEEQMIQLWRRGEAFFWTGGPGEEAFHVALASCFRLGRGPGFDYFHPHYRNLGVYLSLGGEGENFRATCRDVIRQMRNLATDPFSGGRNFGSHFCDNTRNIIPVSSPVATQCVLGMGTALAQRRAHALGGEPSVSVVVLGDASSASPDFESALVWSCRPGQELPLLMIVTQNGVGISTQSSEQLAAVARRAKGFGIAHARADGISARSADESVRAAFDYVRGERRPYLLEIEVSRVYGHSSSSGAQKNQLERCPIDEFEKAFKNWITPTDTEAFSEEFRSLFWAAYRDVEGEARPDATSLYRHTYAESPAHGLPGRGFADTL